MLLLVVLRWVPPLTSAFMLQRQFGALLRGESAWIQYRWVGWREIPLSMKLAAIASEDQKFPSHWGFDFESITDAAQENEGRRRPRGASTITQQVAKNLFLWPDRSWVRKGLEAYFTIWIEILWPKRRVLEVYLNVAEMGDGIYGVGAAAEELFGVRPSRLSTRQCALLAAVLPSPQRFRANRPSAYVARRADWIQRQMWQLGTGYVAALERGHRAEALATQGAAAGRRKEAAPPLDDESAAQATAADSGLFSSPDTVPAGDSGDIFISDESTVFPRDSVDIVVPDSGDVPLEPVEEVPPVDHDEEGAGP